MQSRTTQGNKTTLSKFFVFNPTISRKETTEHENILYYYPTSTNLDRQTIDIGLSRGLIGFTSTFSPDQPIEVMQTEKHQQVFYQAEENFWFVLVAARPTKEGKKDTSDVRELEHKILLGMLEKAYRMFRFIKGPLQNLLQSSVDKCKSVIGEYFDMYIPHLAVEVADLFDAIDGIQYLPVLRISFLKVQSFVNKVETHFEDAILATTALVDDHLLYSGVNQNDTRCLYNFLTKRKTRAKGETLNPSRGDHGAYLSCTPNLNPDGTGFLTMEHNANKKVSRIAAVKVYLTDPHREVSLVVWQHQRALFAFFVKPSYAEDMAFHQQLEKFIQEGIKDTALSVLENVDYSRKQVDETSHYIYFNQMNLAMKTSMKKKGTVVGAHPNTISSTDISDLMGYMETIHADFQNTPDTKEIIMKAKRNEQWVAGRRSGNREFYALFDAKNTLVDVTEELNRISNVFFNGIFLH